MTGHSNIRSAALAALFFTASNDMTGRNVTICAGISGFGKSTFGLRYLANADLAVRFLFDPDPGEFNPELGEFADRLGLPPARTPYELALALCQGWVAFDPHYMFPGMMREAFEWFCEFCWDMSAAVPGKKILVADEIWNYQTPQGIPRELAAIVQSGRKRGLHLMANIQEPNRLNSSILNGVSEFVCFRLQSELALKVAKNFQFDPDEVANLAPLDFVARNCDTGGMLRGQVTL
jgi:hypothetical protein